MKKSTGTIGNKTDKRSCGFFDTVTIEHGISFLVIGLLLALNSDFIAESVLAIIGTLLERNSKAKPNIALCSSFLYYIALMLIIIAASIIANKMWRYLQKRIKRE